MIRNNVIISQGTYMSALLWLTELCNVMHLSSLFSMKIEKTALRFVAFEV